MTSWPTPLIRSRKATSNNGRWLSSDEFINAFPSKSRFVAAVLWDVPVSSCLFELTALLKVLCSGPLLWYVVTPLAGSLAHSSNLGLTQRKGRSIFSSPHPEVSSVRNSWVRRRITPAYTPSSLQPGSKTWKSFKENVADVPYLQAAALFDQIQFYYNLSKNFNCEPNKRLICSIFGTVCSIRSHIVTDHI